MGYYIQTKNPKGKAKAICDLYKGQIIDEPMFFDEVPDGMGLICVVDNGPFEAAGFCFDEREFEAFTRPDGRPRTWILMKREEAEKQSGFKK